MGILRIGYGDFGAEVVDSAAGGVVGMEAEVFVVATASSTTAMFVVRCSCSLSGAIDEGRPVGIRDISWD